MLDRKTPRFQASERLRRGYGVLRYRGSRTTLRRANAAASPMTARRHGLSTILERKWDLPCPVCLIFSNQSEAAVHEHPRVSGHEPASEVRRCGAPGRGDRKSVV